MNKQISVLDTTLRDGGLGLEDAYINKISDIGFSNEDYNDLIRHLSDSNLDIIELGAIEISAEDKTRFAIFQNIEDISKNIPKEKKANQIYVGLYRGPDTPLEDIPSWNPSLIEGVRVIIRYSELQKSLDFCSELSKKGYKVFVQPMLTMRYTREEIDLIIRESNKMKAYAVYFVDSYGYMQPDDVIKFVEKYNVGLDKNIRMGFHAHNNMNLAYANVLAFIEREIDREIIVDACAIGMGQGAGNLQTELIVPYLNKSNNRYNYSAVLEMCEIVEKYLGLNAWGYSVTRLLPALYNTAYKYAIVLRNTYGLTFSEINQILCNMPQELRHRYTLENVKWLMEENHIKG